MLGPCTGRRLHRAVLTPDAVSAGLRLGQPTNDPSRTLCYSPSWHNSPPHQDSLSSSHSATGISVCLLRPVGMHDSFREEQLGLRFLLTQPDSESAGHPAFGVLQLMPFVNPGSRQLSSCNYSQHVIIIWFAQIFCFSSNITLAL